MIRATQRAGRDYLLLGVVRGLPSEVAPVLEAIDAFRPDAIGVGVPPAELDGLNEHFVGTPTEPLVPLAAMEAAEIRGLVRYGEVHLPNPAFIGVLGWAKAHGVPVTALDPDDGEYVDLFTGHIGYLELVRRTLRERRLAKRPPTSPTPDEFVLEWDRTRSPGAGSARFAEAREAALVDGLRRLAPKAGRVGAVVDRERFDRVAARLRVADGGAPARVPA